MDPGEKIQEAAEREVREETGINAEFLGVLGIRETARFHYGASDLYFGAILLSKSTEFAIEDVTEVKKAQWIPLEAVTHNQKDPKPEYPMYPTAYAYVEEIQRQIAEFKAGASGCDTIEEFFRKRNLCKPG